MLEVYIDESYREGDVYLVGGIVVDRFQRDAIDFALDEVVRKNAKTNSAFPLDVEFHGQSLFQRSSEWSFLRDRHRLAYGIYRRALFRGVQSNCKWFIAGVRRPDRLQSRYVNPWPPHAIALQYVLELIDEYAEQQNQEVKIIADTVQNQHLHESRMLLFKERGVTPGWKPRSLANINPDFMWVDSREHRSLQLADMLNYVYFRKRFSVNPHKRTVIEVQKLREIAFPALAKAHIWTP